MGWIVVGVLLGVGGILACCFEKFGLGVFLFVSATISFIIAAIMAGLTWGSGGPMGAIICSLFAVACAVGLVICIVRGKAEGWTDATSYKSSNNGDSYVQNQVATTKTKDQIAKDKKLSVINNKIQTIYIFYDCLKESDDNILKVVETVFERNMDNENIIESAKVLTKELYQTIDEKELKSISNMQLGKELSIQNGVLKGWKNTQGSKLIIPDTVESIASKAFNNCENLKTIILPPSIKRIGEHAFSSSGLVNIALPVGLEIIGAGAFEECQNLTVRIPTSVVEIGYRAFADCSDLTIIYEGREWQWGTIKKDNIFGYVIKTNVKEFICLG